MVMAVIAIVDVTVSAADVAESSVKSSGSVAVVVVLTLGPLVALFFMS